MDSWLDFVDGVGTGNDARRRLCCFSTVSTVIVIVIVIALTVLRVLVAELAAQGLAAEIRCRVLVAKLPAKAPLSRSRSRRPRGGVSVVSVVVGHGHVAVLVAPEELTA